MPYFIHQFSLYLHILCGAIALLVFWLPLWSKKGTPFHRSAGQVFVYGMYAVSISGIIMSTIVLLDPVGIRAPDSVLPPDEVNALASRARLFAGFLFMLSILVVTNVRHSVLVLQAKANRAQLRTPTHLVLLIFLGLLGVVVGIIGIQNGVLLFMIFSLVAMGSSTAMLRYSFKKHLKAREWIIEHMGNIIGAGIASYTAFFAFGGSRLFAELLQGNLSVIPWVLPGIAGGVASAYL
ncbi:MAG: hypothetical protein ACR2PS_08920, partial [Pseudomonadales bacterium]